MPTRLTLYDGYGNEVESRVSTAQRATEYAYEFLLAMAMEGVAGSVTFAPADADCDDSTPVATPCSPA